MRRNAPTSEIRSPSFGMRFEVFMRCALLLLRASLRKIRDRAFGQDGVFEFFAPHFFFFRLLDVFIGLSFPRTLCCKLTDFGPDWLAVGRAPMVAVCR